MVDPTKLIDCAASIWCIDATAMLLFFSCSSLTLFMMSCCFLVDIFHLVFKGLFKMNQLTSYWENESLIRYHERNVEAAENEKKRKTERGNKRDDTCEWRELQRNTERKRKPVVRWRRPCSWIGEDGEEEEEEGEYKGVVKQGDRA